MPGENKKSVKFKMTFPEMILGEPVIHKLSHDMDVVPNILRGRITESDAWLEIELVGSGPDIEKALEFLKERNVSVEKLES